MGEKCPGKQNKAQQLITEKEKKIHKIIGKKKKTTAANNRKNKNRKQENKNNNFLFRSGLVWSGLAWSGLAWSGLVRSGLVRSGLVWSGLYRGLLLVSLVSHCLLQAFTISLQLKPGRTFTLPTTGIYHQPRAETWQVFHITNSLQL